jgi:hypothetical protein
MKIRITENQFNKLINEQIMLVDKFLSVKDKMLALYKNMKNVLKGNIDTYKNVIPGIADRYYGVDTVKSDAFRHILASAFFTTTIGHNMTWVGGQANELAGAMKNFLKGEGFDSGWVMDTKNNDIGISIGMKNPKSDINQLSSIVKKVIDSGNFFTKKGILFKNDPNPEK